MSEHITFRPIEDTILNMTPASGVVEFTSPDGETWTLPLVGWGVRISSVDEETGEWAAHIEPMVLYRDYRPEPVCDYLQFYDAKPRVVIDK